MTLFLFAVFERIFRSTTPLSSEALEALYREKGALVLRRAQIILRDRAEAEDVLQEVFVRVMRYGAPSGADEVPLSFLYRTTERCCFDHLKRRTRQVHVGASEGLDVLLVHEDGAARSEAGDILMRFFGSLPEKLQRVALLHYVDGLTQERIAAELGWSRRTVGKKLRALEECAKRFEKRASRQNVVPTLSASNGLNSKLNVDEEP